MNEQWLMIRNPGVANPEALTTIGISTSRYREGLIGQFGSGSKMAACLLMRHGIKPVFMIDNLHLYFDHQTTTIDGREYRPVVVKFGGKDLDGKNRTSTEKLSYVVEMGEVDWTDPNMALRELVSNALDGAKAGGHDVDSVEIKVVDKPRAKAGHTAVFIPFGDIAQKFLAELNLRFLHFRKDGSLEKELLPKREPGKTYVYKHGVLAAVLKEDSAYDYNLDDLTLDECRNASEWNVKYAVSRAIRRAEAGSLAVILKAVIEKKELFEVGLGTDYIKANAYESDQKVVEEGRQRWQAAWEAVAGKDSVATSGLTGMEDTIRRKGFRPVVLDNKWLLALDSYQVKTEATLLTNLERKGNEILPPTDEAVKAVDRVWALLETYGRTNGKEKPPVHCFRTIMNGGEQLEGYYQNGAVYLRQELAGKDAFKVALEEVVHYTTGSGDMSRDIQDFLFLLVTDMAF